MVLSLLTHLQCWACCDLDERAELQVAGSELRLQQLNFTKSCLVAYSCGLGGSWATDERIGDERKGRTVASPKGTKRHELKEMMRIFANRSMQGVCVLLFDECAGTLLEGSYQMDDRLQTISFDTTDSIAFGGPSQFIKIDQILDVVTSNEAIHHIEAGAWQQLRNVEIDRLVVVVYNRDVPESLSAVDCRKVCFLETDHESAKTFAKCIRILQRYFEETYRPKFQSI
eukprot:symbB.v1.2.019853.t1/scaffold1603.1/size109661/6